MTLKYTSIFNNFGAEDFNIINNGLIDHNSILLQLGLILKQTSKEVIVFGPYSNSFNKQVKIENGFIFDSWHYTVEGIEKKYIAQSNTAFVITQEHLSTLEDPRVLLIAIKRLLLKNDTLDFYLITQNFKSGFFTWSSEAFLNFIKSSGFDTNFITDDILSLQLKKDRYKEYLDKAGVNPNYINSNQLLLTTEDARVRPTGGIGTYVKNIAGLNPDLPIVFCDIYSELNEEQKKIVLYHTLFTEYMESTSYYEGLSLIELVKSILYLLPNIEFIEFQDYQSLGFRIVQARKMGMLPAYLKLRVFLHANIDHIKHGYQSPTDLNYTFEECKSVVKDYFIFSEVEQCKAPSNYILNLLQKEYDYKLSAPSVQKLPFDLTILPKDLDLKLENIQEIAFIGKYNDLKGYYDFIDCIKDLVQTDQVPSSVSSIRLISPGKPNEKDWAFLPSHISLKTVHFKHHELMDHINAFKNSTLFIVPSRGESYSFVVLELLLLGALFIGYEAGAIPDVVEYPEAQQQLLCLPNPKALKLKILSVLNSDYESLSKFINGNKKKIRNRQVEINDSWKGSLNELHKISSTITTVVKHTEFDASIAIPIYNTDLEYITDLIHSINLQRLRPKEVIFVNDGSEFHYSDALQKVIKENINKNIPYRLINQKNGGLAAARNTGLNENKSEFCYFIDSDDVLTPNSILSGSIALSANPDYAGVGGFPNFFKEMNDPTLKNSLVHQGYFWKPIGLHTAKSVALKENHFIPASAFFRVSELKEVGGWDGSDKSIYEDWSLYSKLAWNNKKISIIPSIGYLYRNTPGSMFKTYNIFFGRRRLVRNLPGISKFDANIIFSLINEDPNRHRLIELENANRWYEETLAKLRGELEKHNVEYTLPQKEASALNNISLLEMEQAYIKKVQQIQDWYNKEYEVLPLWYKRLGHVIKAMLRKRSFKSLFD